jgi:Baculovirus F protein
MKIITILSSILLLEIFAHHIIFENIGQLASGVTYIHAHVPINFSAVEDQWQLYKGLLDRLDYTIRDLNTTALKGKEMNHLWIDDINRSKDTILQFLLQAEQMPLVLEGVRASLPRPLNNEDQYLRDQEYNFTIRKPSLNMMGKVAKKIPAPLKLERTASPTGYRINRHRIPRVPGLNLITGVIGTFMGIYNTMRINQLGEDLTHLKKAHNFLVDVVQDHSHKIETLQDTVTSMTKYLQRSSRISAAALATQLTRLEASLNAEMDKIIHAVQMAQLHRLSVDLLSSENLERMFKRLGKLADKQNNQLLITQPSDLFQLEVTYYCDGQDCHLLVHVPTIPQAGLLDLFQLHPFPLELDGNYSLIPIVKNNVLGLTTDNRKYHTQLSTTDLMDCLKVNQVYVCERHGVLIKELNSTCVGALYLQDFQGAQELCPIQVTPTQEIVFQMLGNWFLIFSPEPYTAEVFCGNGSRSRFFISEGVSKHHLSPGCQAEFQQHVLISNNAVRLDSDIMHFEWHWEDKFFNHNDVNELITGIQALHTSGTSQPTLNDLNHLKLNRRSALSYLFQLLSFIFSTTVTALITIGILYFLLRYRNQVYQQYDLCKSKCTSCLPTPEPIEPMYHVSSAPESPQRALPRYTSTYRNADNLYPDPKFHPDPQ